ncbi:MAG: hypothetical protein LBO70_04045 [Clostridiales Family XIII bacterium]|jgi:hypothetical protein|nr:hypothetical protein [Clostridiales Family XIII bacterium]
MPGSVEQAKFIIKDRPDVSSRSKTRIELNVQFNPSSLRFESNAESYQAKGMMAHLSDLPNQVDRRASIVLNVDLIFDAVQNADAFHGDALRLSSQDVVSRTAATAFGGMGGKDSDYSVLHRTNLMIALLISSPLVVFNWGNQSFSGVLTEVQARYVMFSPTGHPIRSRLSIRIQQFIDEKRGLQYWENAYEKLFVDDKVRASHEKSILQQQSFLNL